MSTKKKRLLDLAIAQYPEWTKEKIYAFILSGNVEANGAVEKNPAREYPLSSEITIKGSPYVSRGAVKLSKPLDLWKLDPTGKTVLDAGASTGGFTQQLLLRGALRVYSVDVGYNQLDYKLRSDPRVVVLERTNIMELTPDLLAHGMPDFAVADLSFRSICKAASHIVSFTKEKTAVVLIKPQFEWENAPSDFNGVIQSNSVLIEILSQTARKLEEEGLVVEHAVESPITGKEGNREFFFKLKESNIGSKAISQNDIEKLVLNGTPF